MIDLTHFVFGLSLAYILDKRLITTSAFALVPNFDKSFNFLYPFTSNVIMHSLFMAGVFTFLVYLYTEDRGSAESCFLGYAVSGLGLDLLTSPSIPLFFPISKSFTIYSAPANSFVANLSVITISLGLIFLKKYEIVSIELPNNL